MRIVGIAVFSLMVATVNAQGSENPIDLDRPGALDQLEVERPAHYQAVSEVLLMAERLPCESEDLQSLKARFDIKGLTCHLLVKTSLPPKRRVTFILENVPYVALVTLRGSGGTERDARARHRPRR